MLNTDYSPYKIGLNKVDLNPQTSTRITFLSLVSPDHGGAIHESLGPEALAGHLMQNYGSNVNVTHIDFQLKRFAFDIKGVVSNMVEEKVEIIGISVKIGSQKQLDELIKEIESVNWKDRKLPLIVLGGVVPTFSDEILVERYPNCIISRGEGEAAWQALVEYSKGSIELNDIPGITYIKDGSIVKTENVLIAPDELTLPARLLTKEISEMGGEVWLEYTRGCSYTCGFCSRATLRGDGFAPNSNVRRVVDDMEILQSMGITSVSFTDDDFLGSKEDALALANELIRRGIRIKFSMSTRADHIYDEKSTGEINNPVSLELIRKLKEAGLEKVFIGLESGSPTQLKRYGKGISVKANLRALEILWQEGVEVVAGYIPIEPSMSLKELRENINFLRDTGMYKKVSNPLSELRVQKGSKLLNGYLRDGYVTNESLEDNLVFYKIVKYADPRIEQIAKLANEWVSEVYDLVFALKGIVANRGIKVSKVEDILSDFRELEMNYLDSLIKRFESEDVLKDTIHDITQSFKERRKELINEFRRVAKEDNILARNYRLQSILEKY
jgi:radical SAM superfamily enzyme YgiQ (UPF0313 family)